MKLRLAIGTIAMLVLVNGAYGQKDERLYGVWKMSYYARGRQVMDWTGVMMITSEHFSCNYMAKKRPLIQERYGKVDDLTVTCPHEWYHSLS